MLYILIGVYLFLVCGYFRENKLFNLNCSIVFLFLALNNYNGFDWINYYSTYQDSTVLELLSMQALAESGSPAFMLVLAIAKLADTYIIVFAISALLFLLAVRALAEHHKNKNIVLFLCFSFFAYYYYIERIKQGFSISLVIFAVAFLLKDKRTKAWGAIFLACLFHSSAFLAIPVLFFPYNSVAANRRGHSIGVAVVLLFSAAIYFLQQPNVIGFLPAPLLYYFDAYDEQLSILNLGFFVSVGGLSFLFLLVVLYRIAASRPRLATRNFAFYAYLFSYITNLYYGFSRINNYFYPYVINILAEYAGDRSRRSFWRIMVLCSALIQLARPMATSYYFDSIIGYEVWGLSS